MSLQKAKEKLPGFMLLLLLTCTAPLAIGATTPATRNVCNTPACITLAHMLHNYHDPSVDPCDNFHQFACGREHEHETEDIYTKKTKTINNIMKRFLKKNETSRSKSENAMRTLYKACKTLEKNSTASRNKALQDIFQDIQSIGAWPVVDDKWDESKFDLNDFLVNLVRLGRKNFGLFQMARYVNVRNFAIGPEAAWRHNVDLGKTISEILKANSVQTNNKKLLDDLAEYVNLEKALSQHKFNTVQPGYIFSERSDFVSSVNFSRLVLEMMSPDKRTLFPEVYQIMYLTNTSLFFGKNNNLETIIRNTSKRALANYLIFKFIDTSIADLTYGSPSAFCEQKVINFLPRAALRAFYRNFISKENRKKITKLTEATQVQLLKIIGATDWMSIKSKKIAMDRVSSMNMVIGYPDYFDPPGKLDGLFEHLNLSSSDTYYTVVRKINRFMREQEMDYYTGEVPYYPLFPGLMTNAMYNANDNNLMIFAPFFDDPFFDSSFPDYANIAFTSNTLAHEMGHTFSPHLMDIMTGTTEVWLTPKETEEYEKRVKCLEDQYTEYDDPEYGRIAKSCIV
ncbi:NEPrilysin metallopeptidase family [Caenorhabditis elegans]|uniref:NEPrilysin metallopeptidase family n=1 Tax=Caenorhabditis elegans TaxID=6239 RepID=Q9U2T0_CAEEL|nr:NEPrilysin metallopeptidase family [Caenorhabditis elegans]CAB55147.3 NEPrilysin metallopeptidase family [Caenorhabditis elegans]|eukprot:NP_503005.3 NEPrilysin metallopeptidase family [Caenorhabditis elegans]